MAFITYCNICKTETLHHGTECLICKEKELRNKKEEFLQQRSKLTIEERVLLLESELFEHINRPTLKDKLYA
jgi:hypothetical protein